jgi:hypothetical protein
MMEGSGSRSIPLTNGSGSGRPKISGSGFGTLVVSTLNNSNYSVLTY